MRRAWLALLLAPWLAAAQPGRAAPPAPPPIAPPVAVPTADDDWVPRLAEALAARDDARTRVIAGEAALSSARHRHHPRGKALEKVEKDLDDARKDLAAAEERFPELVEQARQAGVSPTALRPFEEAADAEPPASTP